MKFLSVCHFIVCAIMFCLPSFCKGQKRKLFGEHLQPPTAKELANEEAAHQCVKKNLQRFEQRISYYPFNKTAIIQFVSFQENILHTDDEVILKRDSLPRLNDTICYSKLKEVKTLTLSEVGKLSDLFYNYGYKGPVQIGSFANCYNPRNAILFLDTSRKVIAFIEICFECRRVEFSSEKISIGELCDQKMDMLYRLFQQVGIRYGVTDVPFYKP